MPHRIVVTRRCPDPTERGSGLPAGIAPRTLSLDEWLAHVEVDPALVPVRLAANEDESLRAAHPIRLVDRSSDGWMYWVAGEIRAGGPDPALSDAMERIARVLGARVLREDDDRLHGAVSRLPGEGGPGSTRTPHPTAPRRGVDRDGRPSITLPARDRARKDPFGIGPRPGAPPLDDGCSIAGTRLSGATAARSGEEEREREDAEARAERRSAQALLVVGTLTVVCAASVVWMMQA